MEEIERLVIRETLEQTRGDKNLAAQILGIAARTIYRKLDRDEEGRLVEPGPDGGDGRATRCQSGGAPASRAARLLPNWQHAAPRRRTVAAQPRDFPVDHGG